MGFQTLEEEVAHLRIRCANLEKSYREAYPETITRGRKEGAQQMLKKIAEWLKSDDAKAQRHCSFLIQHLFGQTGSLFAECIEEKFGEK